MRLQPKKSEGLPGVYPGFCRDKHLPNSQSALRVKTDNLEIGFHDYLQGAIVENMGLAHGDFVIKRKDGVFAYQLAVVVDDHAQQVNQVVRGFDLLDSTSKQIFLQQLLGYPPPSYMHVPVIVDRHGEKLSKQTCAQAVDCNKPAATLFLLLELLKMRPPAALRSAAINDLLDWAILHWQVERLKNIRAIKQTCD